MDINTYKSICTEVDLLFLPDIEEERKKLLVALDAILDRHGVTYIEWIEAIEAEIDKKRLNDEDNTINYGAINLEALRVLIGSRVLWLRLLGENHPYGIEIGTVNGEKITIGTCWDGDLYIELQSREDD